jgi:cyclopropane fatty-acyl-phospholipid synthase-like methyltransferase
MIFDRVFNSSKAARYNSAAAYERHLRSKLRLHAGNRDLAYADAIGSETLELFRSQGDAQLAILKHHGLKDGMSIYDLGCGCGRTAQALQRAGWNGHYIGADIVEGLVSELKRKCPGYEAYVHREPSIVAKDASLDILFHWSVFTHISVEECFLYLEDSFRALKPGGKLVFSFVELTDASHYNRIFESRVGRLRRNRDLPLLDTFLHRDWIRLWADKLGFEGVDFTDGNDNSQHPEAWQAIASMMKRS